MTTTLLLIILGILLVALLFGAGAWRARRKRDFEGEAKLPLEVDHLHMRNAEDLEKVWDLIITTPEGAELRKLILRQGGSFTEKRTGGKK